MLALSALSWKEPELGYLQSIKTPEMYVRMMRALMFRMPETEREEACEEVRQHLTALVEDNQAEGHSPQEALLLAITRFGPPFKVGRNIAQKWEAKREKLLQASQPKLARQTKWVRYRYFVLGGMPVLFVMNYHYWPVILVVASVHGFAMGSLFHQLQRLNTKAAVPEGSMATRDRSDAVELWKEKLPQIDAQLRQSKTIWGKLNLYSARWLGRRFISKEQPASGWKRKLVWQILGLAYLGALILWHPVDPLVNLRWLLVFFFVSNKMSSVSRSIADRRFPLEKAS